MHEKLAIEGGRPVRDKNRPFPPWPYFPEEDIRATIEPLRIGKPNYWTGSKGMEFQRKFAEYCGVKYGVAVNSGTSALHVAVAAAKIGPGDEVIVPCYTFIATAVCVLHQNAVPVFCDVDPKTHNTAAEFIEEKITERTKAVIPVDLYGLPVDMDPIMDLAKKHNLIVIEDAAEAHGAQYKGRKTGSLSHIAAFSFCQDKIITTGGEGGMVTTNDDDMAHSARTFKDHGFWEMERRSLLEMEALYTYIHHQMGFNYRMTEMQAAIGLSQLARLDDMVEKRRENAHFLNQRLSQIESINIPYEPPEMKHAYYRYVFTLNLEKLTCSRDRFVEALKAEGVSAGVAFWPENYKEEVFRNLAGYGKTHCPFTCPWYKGKVEYTQVVCPNARDVGSKAVVIQVHPTLKEEDMNDVATAIEKVAKAYAK